MARKGIPEISAGSMADIAFLLLIFFLVTTTMEKESGMMRMLPEWEQKDPEEVNERNVISILVNDQNKVLFKGELVGISEIKEKLAEVVLNESNNPEWPENISIDRTDLETLLEQKKLLLEASPDSKNAKKAVENAKLRLLAFDTFGSTFKKSKHVVSIQSTRGAEYETYIEVSDQILLGYRVMKDKAAKRRWNKGWNDLNKEEKRMLNLMYKSSISEAQTVKGE